MSTLLLGALACQARSTPKEKEAETNPVEAVVDEGCPHQDGGTCPHPDTGGAKKAPLGESPQLFGSPLPSSTSKEVPLESILESPEEFHQKQVLVSGKVKRACSRRGCWMEIAPNEGPSALGCRVTFKDYGFLVPTDSQGSHARLSGTVQVTEIPKKAVDHYESEGGTFPNKLPDGTAREVRIVATGVELTRQS